MSEQQGICAFVPAGFRKGQPDRVFGMGILIQDGLVLTCAHVIEAVLNEPVDSATPVPPFRLWFPFASPGGSVAATLNPTRWYPVAAAAEPRDVAVLRLQESVPRGVVPARLAGHALDSSVQAFGFRAATVGGRAITSDRGEWARGEIAGAVVGGRVQSDRLSLTGVGVEPGFSGGGVYDTVQDAVVGMMTEVDATPARAYFQFVDTAVLRLALRADAGGELPERTFDAGKVEATRARLAAIAAVLEQGLATTPGPRVGQSSRGYLLALLRGGLALSLARAGFGLPETPEAAEALAAVLDQDEPSTRPFASILAQRLDHVLWRVEWSLQLIAQPWVEGERAKVRALQAMSAPDILWRTPTLAHLLSTLQAGGDLTVLAEPGPDAALYTVLRALGDAGTRRSGLSPATEQKARARALAYVHESLQRIVDGTTVVDDTSNAWWAVRVGVCLKDARLRGLLPDVADRINLNAARVSSLRGTALPEIYTADRAAAYTLSNLQAIVEAAPDLDAAVLGQLHVIIEDMSQRLLDASPTAHFYLASAHYEGLNNYLDYVRQIAPGRF